MRAFRGLALGLSISLVNLTGAFLTLMAFGGLEPWSGTQFLGCFGLLEVATGIAFIICPNIWRLPVAEANTPRTDIRLAASTIFIPHWAAGVKGIAGSAMLVYAGREEGVSAMTVTIVPEAAAIVVAFLALSLLFARVGVMRPDLDVVQFVVKRPKHKPIEYPGLSIGAMFVQLLLNIGAFPAVKLLPPSVLFRPELTASAGLLLWTMAGAAVLSVAAWGAWYGRFAWQAPREQQREAERLA